MILCWAIFTAILSHTRPMGNGMTPWWKYLLKFTSEAIWVWCFLFWVVTNCWFNFFNRYRPIQIICFFLYAFWQIVSLKKLVHFIQVIKFVGTELLTICFYYPFTIFGISSDAPSFTSDISDLRTACFFTWLEARRFCWLFWRTSSWLQWLSLLISTFISYS